MVDIYSIMLKICAPEFAAYLTYLLQTSYDKGIFLDSCKATRVQSVPKKPFKSIPSN